MDVVATLPSVPRCYRRRLVTAFQVLQVRQEGPWYARSFRATAKDAMLFVAAVALDELTQLLSQRTLFFREHAVELAVTFQQLKAAKELSGNPDAWCEESKNDIRLDFLERWKQTIGGVADVFGRDVQDPQTAAAEDKAATGHAYLILPTDGRAPLVTWTHYANRVSIRLTGRNGRLIAEGLKHIRSYLDSRPAAVQAAK